MTAAATQARPATSPRPNADQIREILIVDDHPLMCDALALTLKISFGLKNVRTARSLAAARSRERGWGL